MFNKFVKNALFAAIKKKVDFTKKKNVSPFMDINNKINVGTYTMKNLEFFFTSKNWKKKTYFNMQNTKSYFQKTFQPIF